MHSFLLWLYFLVAASHCHASCTDLTRLSDNWTENFPQSLPLDKVPAKSPYPAPSWTSPPPTLTNLVLPIPRPLLPPPIPNNVHNLGQEQQSITSPSPVPPQQVDHPQSAEQPAEQESAVRNLLHYLEAFCDTVPCTSPPIYSNLTNHLHNTHLTHNFLFSRKLEVVMFPRPKHDHHHPNLLRSWILTSWVGLASFVMFRIAIDSCPVM